ncbi:sirohydrochlorin ferrochelatase, chloroplastic-like isoform X2 [Miscanthus floridulus]|uniref:sirohydrochlorin ferrochelatase, chloroplastic-like isoform X2 n=1 Tax=Miscanthus floridulus TaxID=154761 RepID=UPI003458D8FA
MSATGNTASGAQLSRAPTVRLLHQVLCQENQLLLMLLPLLNSHKALGENCPLPALYGTPAKQLVSRSTAVRKAIHFVNLRRAGRSSGNMAMNSIPKPALGPETSGREDFAVGDKDVVVIVDHGSRRQESNLMLNDFVEMFRAKTSYRIVEPAHMELAEPTIKDAFGKCVQQGASRVVVRSIFPFPWTTLEAKIPALAAEASKEHSNIPYVVTAPFGLHELMVVCALARRERNES